MKKVFSLIAVLALVCFTTMVFAAEAPKTEAANPTAVTAPAKAEAAKAEVAKAEVVIGKITKIDTAKNEIMVKGKAIVVKAEDIATLKKGEKVKVTLAAGTNNAEKIEVLKAKKVAKKVEKVEKKAEEKPAEK
jgi:hypothetical protein